MIVAWDRSCVIVSDRGCPLAIAGPTAGGGVEGRAQPPRRASTWRRASSTRDRADDGDDRGVGAHVLAVEGHDVVAGQLADRLDGPLDRLAVRMARVDQTGQRPRRDGVGILLRALDGGLDLRDLARELGLRERRRRAPPRPAGRGRAPRSRLSTDSETVRPSRPAPASRLPPTNSIASSSCAPAPLGRAPGQQRSRSGWRARPCRRDRTPTPAFRKTRTATIGTSGRSATSSTMPLGRTSRWAMGAASRRASTPRRGRGEPPDDERRHRAHGHGPQSTSGRDRGPASAVSCRPRARSGGHGRRARAPRRRGP